MGFANNDQRAGGKYFNIFGGRFALRVEPGTPGAVERTNKNNRQVHEIFKDSFTAKLNNIRVTDGPYGKNWEFDFRDNEEVWTLQLSFSNSYATNLLKILPMADLSKEMKIQPSEKIVDGKKKSSLFVSQDGVTLKHAYTKDNPNGLPPMEQITVKGQLMWDDTKRLEFLQAMMERDILPKLPRDVAPKQESEPAAARGAVMNAATDGSDDDF